MSREFSRNQRLSTQLLRTLSELLRFETKDPRLAGVSLTSLDLTRDLSIARVYFSTLDPDADPQPVQDGLNSAAGFLRSQLGKAIKVRHVPELRFLHDDSAAVGEHIDHLIDAAVHPEE